MDDAKRELVQDWLRKAGHDLLAARKLADGPEPLLDIALYHCQQAAEKALKGLLVFYDRRVTKVHDIGILLNQAVAVELALSPLVGTVERLSDYATTHRYPGGEPDPSHAGYEAGLRQAEAVYALVLRALPPIVHP